MASSFLKRDKHHMASPNKLEITHCKQQSWFLILKTESRVKRDLGVVSCLPPIPRAPYASLSLARASIVSAFKDEAPEHFNLNEKKASFSIESTKICVYNVLRWFLGADAEKLVLAVLGRQGQRLFDSRLKHSASVKKSDLEVLFESGCFPIAQEGWSKFGPKIK